MGLLDNITKVQGNPSANYLKGGRYLVRITRVAIRPEEHELGFGFRLDCDVLKSNNPDFKPGDSGTVNLNFKKFKNDALANMRRILTAAATCAGLGPGPDGRCTEADITKAFAEKLTGLEQPLVNTIVTVVATTKKNQTNGNTYTLYEVVVPSEEDVAGME